MKQIKSKACLLMLGMILLTTGWTGSALASEESASFSDDVLISETVLSSQSGQGGVVVSNATLSRNVINVNSGAVFTNGDNVLGDHALDNVSGIASVIQNSGHNVIIQSATIVNVNMQ